MEAATLPTRQRVMTLTWNWDRHCKAAHDALGRCSQYKLTSTYLAADDATGQDQYAIRAFADALDDVPMALAENSGLSPITELTAVCETKIFNTTSICMYSHGFIPFS